MNINSYIRYFGNKTFIESPFNDVDALILSELSYINMDLLIPDGETSVCLKDIDVKKMDKDVFYGSVDAPFNKTMLKYMIRSTRFKDLVVCDVERRFSKEDINQFLAFNIILPNNDLFLSFRGTDITLIGWKEDFLLTYQKTMLSQIQALEYVDRILDKYPNNKYYLGGHSKGGNLAFYAAFNINDEQESRLIYAYSFDGPGFREGIERFIQYPKVLNKLIKYRTYNDVIGAFFNNIENYKVVHSTGLLFGGHDPFFWQISMKTGQFIYAKDTSPISKLYEKRFTKWLNSLTYDDRALATDALFELFKGNETIYDLAKNLPKSVVNSKKRMSRYSKEEQVRLKIILKKLFKYLILFSGLSEKEEPKDTLN